MTALPLFLYLSHRILMSIQPPIRKVIKSYTHGHTVGGPHTCRDKCFPPLFHSQTQMHRCVMFPCSAGHEADILSWWSKHPFSGPVQPLKANGPAIAGVPSPTDQCKLLWRVYVLPHWAPALSNMRAVDLDFSYKHMHVYEEISKNILCP